jgi:4-hydroxybenzoate polyprenyltransferase
MPSILTILRLIRLPNLLIIALTLMAVHFLVILPGLTVLEIEPGLDSFAFGLTVITTMLIAAGGYTLNDCYDIEIDRINHPGRQVIGKTISRRVGLQIAIILFVLALVTGLVVSNLIRSVIPVLVFLVAIIVAWGYAVRLKRAFIWGNVAVACMTACTIGMIWLFELLATGLSDIDGAGVGIISRVVFATMLFGGLLNLLREIVKDVEDIKGDSAQLCRSLPVVAGINVAKWVVFTISLITFALLILSQVWLCTQKLHYVSLWLIVGVELPILWFIWLLNRAKQEIDFHLLSSLLKWIMIGGMLALVIFHLSFTF